MQLPSKIWDIRFYMLSGLMIHHTFELTWENLNLFKILKLELLKIIFC